MVDTVAGKVRRQHQQNDVSLERLAPAVKCVVRRMILGFRRRDLHRMLARAKCRISIVSSVAGVVIVATLAWSSSLTTAAAAPKPPGATTVLWANAYDNLQAPGFGIVSDHYNDPGGLHASENSDAADDFTVPSRATWTVSEVDAYGFYQQPTGSLDPGPADGFTVSFAPSITVEGVTQPDGRYLTSRTAHAANQGNAFTLVLDAPVLLGPGRYWVIVAANINLTLHGQWRWMTSALTPKGASAVWRQASTNRECHRWCTLAQAWPTVFSAPTDLRFQLVGTSA
jgi:hypothetical protein